MNGDKCGSCQFKKSYTTGGDEYPAYTTLENCEKNHWDSSGPTYPEVSNFDNCVDYIKKKIKENND